MTESERQHLESCLSGYREKIAREEETLQYPREPQPADPSKARCLADNTTARITRMRISVALLESRLATIAPIFSTASD